MRRATGSWAGAVRFGLTVVLVVSLAGCFGDAPPVPEDRYYRVTLDAPPERSDQPLFDGVVLVQPFGADGLLRDRALVYSVDNPGGELKQHHYHFWTDTPPRLLQEATASYLRLAGIARDVVTPELRVPAEIEVQGHLLRFDRVLGGDVPRVAVELRLALVDARDGQLIVMNSYADEVPCADDSVNAAVRGFNEALSGIYRRFLADIEQAAD